MAQNEIKTLKLETEKLQTLGIESISVSDSSNNKQNCKPLCAEETHVAQSVSSSPENASEKPVAFQLPPSASVSEGVKKTAKPHACKCNHEKTCDLFDNRQEKQAVTVSMKQTSLFLFHNLSKYQKMFEYYTGVNSSTFCMLWQFVSEEGENLRYLHSDTATGKGPKKMGQASCGTGEREKTKQKTARIFSAKDELVFTLVRLRRGRTLKELSFETGVSEAYMRRIFTTWVQLLYIKFSALKKVILPLL